jgi:hypothetical protein
MLMVLVVALVPTANSSVFAIQNGDRCLAAAGTAKESISLVITSPCSNNTKSQHWTYDMNTGRICSVTVDSCLRIMAPSVHNAQRPIPMVALATEGEPASPNGFPQQAFGYNSTSGSLNIRGSCSHVLEAAHTGYPVFISAHNYSGFDCANPSPGQSWKLLEIAPGYTCDFTSLTCKEDPRGSSNKEECSKTCCDIPLNCGMHNNTEICGHKYTTCDVCSTCCHEWLKPQEICDGCVADECASGRNPDCCVSFQCFNGKCQRAFRATGEYPTLVACESAVQGSSKA